MSEDKIIVTITGKDGIGIVAEIAAVLAKYGVNIEDIKQTIMQGCFMMFLLGDISKSKYTFKEIKEALNQTGQKLGMEIWTQKKEIFDNIPSVYNNFSVLSDEQRTLYYESLVYKYNKVFKPIYAKLMEKNISYE